MKIRKREIITERERSVTVRFGNVRQEKFCPACQRRADFISVDQAALVCGATSLTIFRRIEDGRVHALETPEGFLTVCLDSIEADKETGEEIS